MAYVRHYARPLIRRLEGQPISRGKIPWEEVPVVSEHGKQLEEVLIYLIEKGLWLEQEVLVLAGGWQSWPLDAPCGQRSNEKTAIRRF